jgi:predicted tellurium resistance membrane protein TerC
VYAVEAVSAVFAAIVTAVVLSVHVFVVITALALSVVTMQLA